MAYKGKYLGVQVGPDSGDTFWDHAIAKYLGRAKAWGELGMGLHYSIVAYRTYVLPVLSFLAQFKRPSPKVLAAETKALTLMVPGPYQWCSKEDLYHLGKHWGQPLSFPRLDDMCLAARTRLHLFENADRYGLDTRKNTEICTLLLTILVDFSFGALGFQMVSWQTSILARVSWRPLDFQFHTCLRRRPPLRCLNQACGLSITWSSE